MAAKVRLKWLLLCAVVGSGCGEPDWPPPLQKEPAAGVAGWYYGGGRSGGSGGTLHGSGGSSAAGARSDKTRGGAPASGGNDELTPSHAGGEAGAREESAGGSAPVAGSKARGGAGGVRSSAGGAASAAGGARTTGGARATGGVRSDGGTNSAGASAGDTGDESAGTAGMVGGDSTALSPFFSEYLEAGFLKALEVTAATPGSLVGCEVHVHSGSGTSLLRNIPLSESATWAEPLLICTAELAAMHAPCQRVENLRFNGNDVVELLCAGELMDVIGQLGENTVHGWGSAEIRTENRNLRRNCGILSGDSNADDPFEPATEWTGFDIADLSDLGRHCQ